MYIVSGAKVILNIDLRLQKQVRFNFKGAEVTCFVLIVYDDFWFGVEDFIVNIVKISVLDKYSGFWLGYFIYYDGSHHLLGRAEFNFDSLRVPIFSFGFNLTPALGSRRSCLNLKVLAHSRLRDSNA